MLVDKNLERVRMPYVAADGTQYPRQIETAMSDNELALLGWYLVRDDPRPDNARVSGSKLVWRRGQVWREWIEAPRRRPRRDTLSKETIIRRTQAAGKMEAAHAEFQKLAPFYQHLWFSLLEIQRSDSMVRGVLERAGADVDTIMAPATDD